MSLSKIGEKNMVQVNVKVKYENNCYQTNVILDNYTTEEEILRLAEEQVKKTITRKH